MLDLASGIEDGALEKALDSAARGNPEFFFELDEFLSGTRSTGHAGIGRLARMVSARKGGEATGSSFETRLLRMLRDGGLPPPTLQYPVFKIPDRPFVHVDFAWPELRIALFADGESYHQARRRARLDAFQRMELTKLGWKPVVVMPRGLEDPAWLVSFAQMFPVRGFSLWPQ